jgi:hypothetical protein
MVTLTYNGRLGNNLIQYFVSKLFAKKNSLFFNCVPNYLGVDWSTITKEIKTGEIVGNKVMIINDENFIEFLNREIIEPFHYHFSGFFQNKLILEEYEDDIKKLISVIHKEREKDEYIIHYRIGDVSNDRRMLPIEYYEELINYQKGKGFLISDTPSHPNCELLIKKYDLTLVNLHPLESILFAKNFNNIILSEGSFSWWIGFLSKTKNVFYNKRKFKWHGDLFFDKWNYVSWDYDFDNDFEFIKNSNRKPIKINVNN